MVHDRFELDFDERFDGDRLDRDRWIPHYLPHWSTWDPTAARHEIVDGRLHLTIDEDKPPWCPELDGELRVSSLQTGLYAGPVGSHLGQHPFDPPATLRNGPHDVRLYTPTFGRFEVRMAACDDPRLMVAFWMLGLNDTPGQNGEICVVEIFGTDVAAGRAAVGVGVKRQLDPAIVEDFERVPLPVAAGDLHDYAAEWTPERIHFFFDGEKIKTVEQSIVYPMALLLNVYEFPARPGSPRDDRPYSKRFVVDAVRGYRYLG